MTSRVEKAQASLAKAYRQVDIGRLKKVKGYIEKASDIIKAGPFHEPEHKGLMENVGELLVETRSRLDEAIKSEA